MNTITPQKNPWEWEHGWLRQSHDKSKKANVVIKVGGSLFSTSGWQHAVQSLIADEALANHSVVVIAGGGALVDGLRLIDSNSSLPSTLMHGLALEAMGITAQFLASTLKLPLREEVGADCPFVLNMRKWGAAANAITTLPHSWETTSDSIAAAVASATGAGLLLAKSIPPPTPDVESLAFNGWVDQYFQTACIALEDIRWAAPRQ